MKEKPVPSSYSVSEHFNAVRALVEVQANCTIPDDKNLEWLCTDTSPLVSDWAKRALKKTGSMYLDGRSLNCGCDWMNPKHVADQIVQIARRRHRELNGLKKLSEVVAHVFATYGIAYAHTNDSRAFDQIAIHAHNGVYLPERVAILA